MDLGGLAKHNFSTALLQNSRKRHSTAWSSINSHKVSPLGPVFERPITALNSFKVELFVAMPTTAKQVVIW